ncbi:glycosyltransferase [Paenibacillus terreus]|uniref:Glycosyltransferase n=1 Tax=Paenibacillus terreus TaxID=1387834 RepID=A0ABV5BFB0_9BACL
MMNFDFNQQPGLYKRFEFNTNSIPPLISIITPYYFAKKYIRQTSNSIFNQTFPFFEWIIVNDGTNDADDLQLLTKLSQEDPRVKLYHTENGGPSKARNYGVRMSTTDIIVPLDADDLIEPTYLECVYWTLYCNPEASWTYTDSVGFQNQEYLWKKGFDSRRMCSENFLTVTAGIRKKDFLEVGGYPELEKHQYEDWALWLNFLSANKYPVHMNWYGFWYRRTEEGVLFKTSNDEEYYRLAKQSIKKAAAKVKKKIAGIEFPRYKNADFKKPLIWDWDMEIDPLNDKTKILMLLPHMVMGGADLFNLDLAARINKNKYDISIITTNPGDSSWRQRFEKHVTNIFDLTTFLDVEHWCSFIHYFIKSRKIDILFISNSYYGYYILPWIRKEFPDLVIVDYIHMEEMGWRAGGYARTSSAAGDIIEKTYVCNEHLRQLLISRFNRKPEAVQTIYIGVDSTEFDPSLIESGRVRSQFNLGNRPIILFPCRIAEQKRPFLMLEIAKETRKVIPDICFLIVGDGPQLSELRKEIDKRKLNDTVYLAGRQVDMKSFYKDANITLICSIREGLALTAYESLAMEVPVISSDVGGQKELIDSKVGRLLPLLQEKTKYIDIEVSKKYNSNEIKQYVDTIVEMLTDSNEYRNLKKNCRRRINSGFSINQMLANFENEFDKFKEGKGAVERRDLSMKLKSISNLIDDYLVMYNEYEIQAIKYNRLMQIIMYLKDVIKLQKSPLSIIRDFKQMRDNYVVKRFLSKYLSKLSVLKLIRERK